jgi:hypothetical protein
MESLLLTIAALSLNKLGHRRGHLLTGKVERDGKLFRNSGPNQKD